MALAGVAHKFRQRASGSKSRVALVAALIKRLFFITQNF
jgi:hypothetical protein